MESNSNQNGQIPSIDRALTSIVNKDDRNLIATILAGVGVNVNQGIQLKN